MNTTKDHSTPSPFLPLETKLKQITSLIHIYIIYIYIYNYILRCLILDVRSFCTIPSKKCGTCWLDPRTKGLQIVPHYLRWEKLGFINVGLGPNQGQTSQTCFSRSCCAESTHSILKSIALQVWEHWKEETWRCKEHPKNQRISKKIKEPKLEKKRCRFSMFVFDVLAKFALDRPSPPPSWWCHQSGRRCHAYEDYELVWSVTSACLFKSR